MRIAIAAMLVVGVACARTHGGRESVAHEDGSAGAAAQDGSRGGASGWHAIDGNSPGSGSPSVGTDDAAVEPIADDASRDGVPPADEMRAPDASASGPETWIGELWSIAPLLCDPNVQWLTEPILPMGYTEQVVLVLEPGDDSSMPSGVIAFGQGDLPQDPGAAATAMNDSGSFWLCSIQIPSKGGVYSVLDARRDDKRLTFDISPSEIWTKDCTGDLRDCFECTSSCDLLARRVSLDLVIRADTIEGTLISTAFGTPSELRLRRMH